MKSEMIPAREAILCWKPKTDEPLLLARCAWEGF